MSINTKKTLKNQYEICVATTIDLKEIVEFLAHIFGPNYREAHKTQTSILTNEPSKKPRNFILARSMSGELIGLVRIVERTILIEGVPIFYGGISSVGVHADWRGKGVASDLMEYAIPEMRKRKIPLSILYGRRAVDGFYTKYGYYGIGRYRTCELLSGNTHIKHDRALIATSYSPRFASFLATEYQRTYRILSGSILRDRGIWRYLLTRAQASKTPVITILLDPSNKKPIGYCVIKEDTCIECVAPKQWFAMLLSYLYDRNIKKLALHPAHPFDRYVRRTVTTITHERLALDGGYMARVVDWQLFLKALAPALVSQAKSRGLSREKITLQGYTIDLTRCTVEKSHASDDIRGSEHDSMQLMIGLHSLESLDLAINPKKPWIPHLFNRGEFHTSAWDEI